MPNPVYVQTFFTIKKEIARQVGDLVEAGTATSGSATTIVDTGRFIDATDTRLKGVAWYIGNGPRQGSEGRATAFTPSTDTLTIPSGTAITSASEYMLTRQFLQSDILAAMRLVLQAKGPYAKSYDDQSLIAGSPLVNATFYDNSGTFPNGWTVSGGTWTRESTISKHGRYSAKVVSNGTDAALVRQDIPNVGLYRGKSITLRGWVNTDTTGSRVNILVDDGIDTTTGIFNVTTANRGWGSTEAVTAALAVSNRATRLRISCNVTAGPAVTAYFSGLYVDGYDWREWDVPAGTPTVINEIRVEGAQEGPFDEVLYPYHMFESVEEPTLRLRLKGYVPRGRILHIKGRTSWADHATAATDDDTNFDSDPAGLISASAAVLQAKTWSEKQAVLATHWFTNTAIKAPNGSLVLRRQ